MPFEISRNNHKIIRFWISTSAILPLYDIQLIRKFLPIGLKYFAPPRLFVFKHIPTCRAQPFKEKIQFSHSNAFFWFCKYWFYGSSDCWHSQGNVSYFLLYFRLLGIFSKEYSLLLSHLIFFLINKWYYIMIVTALSVVSRSFLSYLLFFLKNNMILHYGWWDGSLLSQVASKNKFFEKCNVTGTRNLLSNIVSLQVKCFPVLSFFRFEIYLKLYW